MSKNSILITGCSTGIGLASAQAMKARGWQVLATARRPEDLERLETKEGLEALHLELRDPESIAKCAAEALERTNGKLFALFNNAAYGQMGAIEDLSVDVMREQFEVNVIGTHDLTQRIVPAMRKAGEGRIVQCSSVLGLVSGPFRGAYSGTKFALEGMSDALRIELRDCGVKVSLIEPGPIWSKFLDTAVSNFKSTVNITGSAHSEAYAERLEKLENGGALPFKLGPEAVAAKLIHAVESPRPKARYYVTRATYIAAACKRALPGPVMDMIVAKN